MTGHRALIVEDDTAIRVLLEKLLRRRGIDVDTAADGQAAIGKLQPRAYSVVVLDLMIPEASGYEVIAHIRRTDPSLPVAVVSAVSQHSLAHLDLDVVRLVITKPFDVDELTQAVIGLCRPTEG
jgi:DNA-binding response OmpR family regulator